MAALLLFSCAGEPSRSLVLTNPSRDDSPILVGEYAESGGAPTLTDCTTHQTLDVLRESDFVALHDAVSALGRDPASPVIVSLMGGGSSETGKFRVQRFLAVWPEETCEKAGVHTTLDNTYWKLVELGGVSYSAHENQPEVHVILRVKSDQISGFSGCNPLSGRYQVDGDRLSFLNLGVVPTDCEYQEEEQEFLDVLTRVTNYQSVGESLQLRDENGPIARLRAVYFR
jgi:copper homeostasis protein (lipoprotein)